MTAGSPYVVHSLDGFAADALFHSGRDQVILAVHITPVYGQLELGLLASIVDEANSRGFTLTREQPFRDEWLLCMFDAYEEEG